MYFFCLQVNGLITRGLITGAREGGGGVLISRSLRYGLCEPQCPDYFFVLKLRAVGRSIIKELQLLLFFNMHR